MSGDSWIWSYLDQRDLIEKIGFKLSSEQINNFLNAFKEIFDNDWYISLPVKKRENILNRDY